VQGAGDHFQPKGVETELNNARFSSLVVMRPIRAEALVE
jgi:hypothetical protein